MATNSITRLWRYYTDLKIWAEKMKPESRIFIDRTPDDESETTSSVSNSAGASSGAQGEHMRIFGLIFPKTAPFQQLGLMVEIRVPVTYPQEPPVLYMRTSIRHPNIEKDGK